MGEITVSVLNVGVVKNHLESIKKMTRVQKAIEQSTLAVMSDAIRLCPVDTGNLRNSISPDIQELKGRVFTNVEYAPYVEFGTGIRGEATNPNRKVSVSYSEDWVGQIAQPFLYPALEQNKNKIRQLINTALGEEVNV